MVLLKYLVAAMLAVASPDGWVPVEQPQKNTEQGEERDSSIWVLFVKELGDEKISVRLPDDPSYKYGTHEFDVTASKDGEEFRLKVQEGGELDGAVQEIIMQPGVVLMQMDRSDARADLVYQSGKEWVQETLIAVPGQLYRFQTVSQNFSSANHIYFVDSFHVEKS